MTPRIGRTRLLVGLLVVLGLTFVLPGVVAAHAELVEAIPADKSTVTEPVSEVSATYTEDLDTDSSLKVRDANNATLATGVVDPNNDRRMVATLAQPLTDGTYAVFSTAIATDGHIEKVTWTFTVSIPATPSPSPTCTEPCASASSAPPPSPSPTVAPTPAASPAPSSPTSSGNDVILPIIAALAIIAIGAGILLSRGRRAGSA
jgi:methionine-rich copper-binding protein CopC